MRVSMKRELRLQLETMFGGAARCSAHRHDPQQTLAWRVFDDSHARRRRQRATNIPVNSDDAMLQTGNRAVERIMHWPARSTA